MEMMMNARPAAEHDTMISDLYQASVQGCVSTLDRLLEADPLILTKLSLTTFSETPLHISASLGHANFTETLLHHMPRLASELNSLRCSPLHLASAEGHTETVKKLLEKNSDVCLASDQDGRIPLHYAAMRGRADVVRELIRAKPDSVKVPDRGATVLQLCIKYNQLETLKELVDFVGDNNEILNARDFNTGNTILHLAAMLKQTENIKYLLSLPGIKEAPNTENHMGFTALDVLEHSPSDYRCLELRCLLMEAGIKSQRNNFDDLQLPENPVNSVVVAAGRVRRPEEENCWKKYLKIVNRWFKQENNWLKETRGNLMVVATVISTMSYQAVIQAPHDVMKDHDLGMAYMTCNGFSFVASLCVILLLLSGLPLKNKFSLWLLTLTMFVNLVVLAQAFILGAKITIGSDRNWTNFAGGSLPLLSALIAISLLFLAVRIFVWVGKKLYGKFRFIRTNSSKNVGATFMNPTQATTAPESSI